MGTTFNGYEYNDCGVCVNPDKPYTFGKWNDFRFEIKVAETPEGWIYGYNYSYIMGGGASLCSAGEVLPSKSKAIIACAEHIKECYSENRGATKAIAELDRIIAEESKKKPTIKQLTIFDCL